MDDPKDYQTHTLYGALVGGPDADDYHHDETKDYIYNEVTDDYNAAFTGALAGLYHFYGAKGKELEKKNYIIKDFNMSENKPGAKDESLGVYVTAGKAQETKAGMQIKIVMHNQTTNPPKFMSDMRARYYFNINEMLEKGEDASYIITRIDYDQEKSFTDGKNYAHISEPIKFDDKGNYYIEISWLDCNFYGSRVYQFGLLNKMHPETFDTVWDPENDYSYSDLISFEDDNDAAALTDKVTAYVDGQLVWGKEPEGGVYGLGDVNLDNRVNNDDAKMLQKYLSNGVKLGAKSDTTSNMNKDKAVNVVDLLILKRQLAAENKKKAKAS